MVSIRDKYTITNLVLCDFGTAAILLKDHLSSTYNIGTKQYIAPEIEERKGKYDPFKADSKNLKIIMTNFGIVFSFGKTLSYILTGRQPTTNQSLIRDDLSPQIYFQIYDQCVQFDPQKRPSAQSIFEKLKSQ